MNLTNLFRPGTIRAKIGQRVRHVTTRQLGTVIGRAQIHGESKIWVLDVNYDNGFKASMIPENEFIPMGRA